IGVDMTEEMLDKARSASKKVAKRLGFDVVEFRKGLLEDIPVGDETVDLVTSNCVINLSTDKGKVFEETYRVLKPSGRFCISDIVAERDVPALLRDGKRLWSECISGALREDEFITLAKRAGFYGIETTKRYLYREVDGIRFYSVTVKGYKFKKASKCVYIGQYATYNGPFKRVWDDDGHEYPVGVPVEVCTDTAEKLSRPPYKGLFTITEPLGTDLKSVPRDEGRGCGPGCC
ncbi:MAG: methyltransferase domain-containing protein, partial [Deltaproteobacteria bacterium]|nr:methyltransferase domain-containing protein [Deltaproteobacteria bacterium]